MTARWLARAREHTGGIDFTCRGLYYALRVNVSNELTTAITTMAVGDMTANGGAAAYANSNSLYFALAAAAALAGARAAT